MASTAEILDQLRAKTDPGNLEGMARYGMSVDRRLGVSVREMRRIAKTTGKDHELAIALWRTGFAEARILASMLAAPEALTERDMEAWVQDLDSWDVCDQVGMNLFEKTPLARRKIIEWSGREEAFVKRAAYALIACLAWHDRRATDEEFLAWLPVIRHGATDERNFVKKAVSWALRHIGKRNPRLNKAAIRTARELRRLDSKAARWIAAEAIRELEDEGTQRRLRAAAATRRRPASAGRCGHRSGDLRRVVTAPQSDGSVLWPPLTSGCPSADASPRLDAGEPTGRLNPIR